MAYDSNHAKLWQDIKADLDKLRARTGKFAADAEWAFGSRTARVLVVLVLFAVVATLLLVFLNWYVAPTKPSDKKDLVLALAQILAGTALLSGLYFTWRNLQLNREGQITERFTRAIDQLGGGEGENKSSEIRLGGIYALERIANESKEDYGVVMEVLTAYLQQHARRQQKEILSEQIIAGARPSASNLRSDIQAIMTVIGRRISHEKNGNEVQLDLHETDLHGANLYEANLEGAIFVGADLRGSFISSSYLTRAILRRADLSGSVLADTDFGNALLHSADLRGTDLSGAIFREANLYEANLTYANLYEANLQGANLQGANLQRADLLVANLQGANLRDADLNGATGITNEELEQQASILEGATMPDGQEYEDWIKDKEGSGEAVENE